MSLHHSTMPLIIHVLACVFGMGSWVAINGLWVELPLIVNVLPEGWGLPSYLTVIIQLANVGPLFVTLMHKFAPGKMKEIIVIYIIISIGIMASLLMIFFWKETTLLTGRPHSTAFLTLAFFLSLVDCTSSVTFLPFMMRLPTKYMTTYFIGEGLSGFAPGLVALSQGVGMVKCVNVSKTINMTVDNFTEWSSIHQIETHYIPANFSTETFLAFLTVMMIFCLVAFFFLTRVPWLPHEEINEEHVADQMVHVSTTESELNKHISKRPTNQQNSSPNCPTKSIDKAKLTDKTQNVATSTFTKYSKQQLLFIYFLVAWVNSLTNGFLPSVQTYSCLPYGNLAYHLSAALGSMANPGACIIALILPKRSLVLLGSLSFVGTAFGAYNMAMAALSPCPLLQHSGAGAFLIVISWILFSGTLSYVKVMIGVIFRDESHSALVWCGAAVQLGSMFGTLTMFPLVSVYDIFKAGDSCKSNCPF
ncbi:solute carrier family 52, riboflavin transporter, member 3-A [Scyliorhinus canicula]|uniref:solute carrier family 52, riboflavin transporter, member 3-A n=1 Tax=Scyliorhinus canicula TaxID=7830 RepID=UPI0018F7BBE5|nr:solute carrier family 52, riboflavin transporter, member 3-A [Scyliorhinus canicula]